MKLLVKMKNVSFILRKKIIWTFGFLAHRLWVTASLCILTRKVRELGGDPYWAVYDTAAKL